MSAADWDLVTPLARTCFACAGLALKQRASAAVGRCLAATGTAGQPPAAWPTLALLAHGLSMRGAPALILQPLMRHLTAARSQPSQPSDAGTTTLSILHESEETAQSRPAGAGAASSPQPGQQQDSASSSAQAAEDLGSGVALVLEGALGAAKPDGVSGLNSMPHKQVVIASSSSCVP